MDDVIDLYTDFYIAYYSFRYSVPFVIGSFPKSQQFLLEIVPQLDDERFKVLFRMGRHTFGQLLHLIENDKCFQYKGRGRKQVSPVIQLQIVLFRLGCSITLNRIAFLFGVGDGGTIITYCRRVFSAILKIRKRYLYWPTTEERRSIVEKTFHEMPHCIGYVDGTEIKLTDSPVDDPDAYLSRKQVHSIKVQIVADWKLRIRHLVSGYPGSCHDSRIYSQCQLYTNPSSFFSENEYLLGDSAYKLTNTVITPFRINARGPGNSAAGRNFNKRLSRYRVRVENTIGHWKERFESLKDLRLPLRDNDGNKFACDWILVCGVIHNFITLQNNVADFIRFDEVFSYEDHGTNTLDVSENADGESKRMALMNFLCK